jgi:hypothetical protein
LWYLLKYGSHARACDSTYVGFPFVWVPEKKYILTAPVVFGDPDSTSYRGHTRPFAFPEPGFLSIIKVDGRLLCHYPDCSKCAASPEFALVHFDCYEIFKQRCSVSASDALSRLWPFAAWASPWRGAQPIHLSAPLVDMGTLGTIARSWGLPLLSTLPLELLEIIRRYSKHSPLWGFITVLQVAAQVSATEPGPLITVPLRDVLVWERDGKLERTTASRPVPSTLRLTVDSAGIRKVERLPGLPSYTGECTNCSAFTVQNETSISNVVVQLKVRPSLIL